MMKALRLFYITLFVLAFIGCSKNDVQPEPVQKMQDVSLNASITEIDTKAQVSSQTGEFSWQEGDQISVLSTDNKFYTLTLTEGSGTSTAFFSGSIPEGCSLTSVAYYPVVAENGAPNTIYNVSGSEFGYNIPSEITYVENSTNIPMVAEFGSAEEKVIFKQVGAVIRFTINALPKAAKIVFTAKNLKANGIMAVTEDEEGNNVISAVKTEGSDSKITVNYTSETEGVAREVSIPVPVGTYADFSIEVLDAENKSLMKKDYERTDKPIERAQLLMMKPIDAGPIVINDVHPFFVDARVFWTRFEGATAYAIYVDDNEPVLVDSTGVNDNILNASIGGQFAHGTQHKVAVAKVVGDEIAEHTKSEFAEFTTGNVMQITNNTGTRFVCAGWDDVAIGVENSSRYVNGKWNLASLVDGLNGRIQRGYRVQLYAEDKTTLLYDKVPFSGQFDYGSAFASSSWLGKIDGKNLVIPTALSFGWLEPGTKYYFRVQTLSEPIIFASVEDGLFKPGSSTYTASSTRGGCAWSDLVELTTDSEYVMGPGDVYHEGFDDMMFNNDLMNVAIAAAPQILTESTSDSDYESRSSADKLKSWMALDFSQRKFSEQGYSKMLNNYEYGLTDDKYSNGNVPRYLNEYAGSLQGYSVISTSEARNMYPSFGAVRLGQSGSSTNRPELRTCPIYSDKLSSETATKCIVTVQVSSSATNTTTVTSRISINQYRNDGIGLVKVDGVPEIDYSKMPDGVTVRPEWIANFNGVEADASATTYLHNPTWFEVQVSFYMKNGDILGFDGVSGIQRGLLVIGDIKVEIDPDDDGSGVERFYGTAPDATNYDVWGLNGEFPVTFWMGPPTLDQANLASLSATDLASVKSTYFDPIVEGGYNLIEISNPYPESMKIILDWCSAAGVKLIDKSIYDFSAAGTPAQMSRIANYASHPAYAGAFVGPDEPGAKTFTTYDAVNDAFAASFPTKGRTINLFPGYANLCQLNCGNTGCTNDHGLVSDMEAYVKYFGQNVDVNYMMYDHYCLSKSDKNGKASRGNVKSYQYYDLDLFRNVSLANRVPFLMITHGRPQWDPGYSATIANNDPKWTTDISATALPPKPDSHVYDEQRWLVWSQIALGSKGVSYFCYWTPGGFKGGPFSFHYDGTKTRMYDILKNINKEIQPIGRILMTCHADGAMMTNPSGYFKLYENDGMGLPSYGPVLSLERGNSEDVLAGCFRDATTGEYKVLVTHKGPATSDSEAATSSIAKLKFDRSMVSKVKLHTVTFGSDKETAATTVVTEQNISGEGLTLTIPDGTAILVEFPETANVNYN